MAELDNAAAVQAMWQILNGFYKSSLARAFVDLRLADYIAGDTREVTALAKAVGADVASLRRFLRAARLLGLCSVDNDSRVSLTPLGRTLRRGMPGSMADWTMFVTSPLITRPWLELATSVRTGRAAFPTVHGAELWIHLATHPKDASLFEAMMTSSSADRARALRAAADISAAGTVVDVGGGQGQLVAMLLEDLPHLHAIVADRAEVLADAVGPLKAAGVAERVELIPTDFFTSVPVGGDIYVLSRIIHDWPDEEAVAILRACRKAMAPGALLYIIDRVVPSEDVDDADWLEYAMEDLDMLVLFGGKERTAAEFTQMLVEAGFRNTRLIGEGGDAFEIIEAQPALT
jgi:hypothetical protein